MNYFKSVRKYSLNYGGIFDLKKLEIEKENLQSKTISPDFWNDKKSAQRILKQIQSIDNEIKLWEDMNNEFLEVELYNELSEIEDKPEPDYEKALIKFSENLDKLEFRKLLNHRDDSRSAILTIHPGAGGTESQDWAKMLFRLYTRWCERTGYKINILDILDGDIAGIKDVSIEVSGDYAYGYLKSEGGVHRLVRISPFDSNSKRHTSFASVFVYPVVDDDVEIKIDEKEIRIDTYRASGAGGQHVNKTDSAIRITHIPTNIVVQCQNERSQLKNKNTAMKMLKAKLYQAELEKQSKEKEKLEQQKMDIGWGSQIRSYIFHPYNLVKDHRTNEEVGNVSAVMDGKIDNFIRAYLLEKLERKQSV